MRPRRIITRPNEAGVTADQKALLQNYERGAVSALDIARTFSPEQMMDETLVLSS